MHRKSIVLCGLSLIIGFEVLGTTPSDYNGFLVTFSWHVDGVWFESAAAIDNYVPSRRPPSESDWVVLLVGESEALLWSGSTPNPRNFSPQPSAPVAVPIVVKVPYLQGARELILQDSSGYERERVALDGGFFRNAAEARARFLTINDENHSRVQVRAESLTTTQKNKQTPRITGSVPDDLRDEVLIQFADQFASDLEKADLYRHSLGLSPQLVGAPSKILDPNTTTAKSAASTKSTNTVLFQGAYTLSGVVRNADTDEPLAGLVFDCSQYDTNDNYVGQVGSFITGSDGRYSLSVDEGRVLITLAETPGSNYARQNVWVGISGDTTYDFVVYPGVELSGTVSTSDGDPIQDANLTAYISGYRPRYFYDPWRDSYPRRYSCDPWCDSSFSDDSGAYTLTVPIGRPLTVVLHPPAPFLQPPPVQINLTTDDSLDFTVEIGQLVSGVVQDERGAPVKGATVVLRHIAETTAHSTTAIADTGSTGRFDLVVSVDLLPPDFVLCASKTGYVRELHRLDLNRYKDVTIVLREGVSVKGAVTDTKSKPLSGARVRALDGSHIVNSTETGSGGWYQLNLTPGVYTFEVLPYLPWMAPSGGTSYPILPETVADVPVNEPISLDFEMADAAGWVDIAVEIGDLGRLGHKLRFESILRGQTVAAYYGGESETVNGRLVVHYRLPLDEETYDVRITGVGFDPILLENVSVSGTPEISYQLPAPFRWKGVVRNAAGAPLGDVRVESYDDLPAYSLGDRTDSDGSFDIPITPGGAVTFWAPGIDVIHHSERLNREITNRDEDIVLGEFPAFADSGGVVSILYGDEHDASRYTIAVVGDGYTDVAESYDDINGNGMWDGIVHYDLNGNGRRDQGEPKQVYGSYNFALGSEPFVDLNGDGFPNEDDQTLFEQNAIGTIRSLLGQDFWVDYRDAFNVYLLRVISNQAGLDVYTSTDVAAIERDTVFGSSIQLGGRRLLNADYSYVVQFVNEHLPGAETIVLLVNQPIPLGRDRSFVLLRGGPTFTSGNDVISHEFGHNIGGLADEYVEFAENYDGPELDRANVTTVTQREAIPWAGMIEDSMPIPSPPFAPGVGLFEGAGYYMGGIYRPVALCNMRIPTLPLFCPVCFRHLEQRLARIQQVIEEVPVGLSPVGNAGTVEPRFAWTSVRGATAYQLVVQRADTEQTAADITLHALSGRLSEPLERRVSYRWRVRGGVEDVWGPWTPWYFFTTDPSRVHRGARRAGHPLRPPPARP